MRLPKRRIFEGFCEYSGVRLVLSSLNRWQGLLTLNYHRIGDAGTSPFDPELFSATQYDFDAHVRFLRKWCDLIVPADLESVLRRPRGRFAMVTFDDGYIDNFTMALPVLQSNGVRATFFVATGLIDRPRVPWWDELVWMTQLDDSRTISLEPWLSTPLTIDPTAPEPARLQLNRLYTQTPAGERNDLLDKLGQRTGRGRCGPSEARSLWMSWDMIRKLQAAGMEIGGHTHEHVRLSEQSPEHQRAELKMCLERIETEVGQKPIAISYPYGKRDDFDQSTRNALEAVDIHYAFSYYGGYARFDRWDPLDIPRVALERYHRLPHLRVLTALPGLMT